jgi:dTDP-4-amino-4,6-dideoxygalactose transaminase
MAKLAINGGAPVRTRPWPRWPQWDAREEQRVLDVLRSDDWGGFAPVVEEFERAFAQHHGATFGIAAVNGTQTLVAALMAVGIGRGDEVIVPPYTFIATASAVRLVGATPVFADIEADTYNLDPAAAEAATTSRTRAIIPVHFAGQAADMDRLTALAQRHGLILIEDAAHAHGASWRGRMCGSLGDVGSFSFQSSKNMTAGEGGALTTNNRALADAIRSRVNQGRAIGGAWYEHPNLGTNMRLSAWQAAVLLAQLERLDEQTDRRMACARRLNAFFAEVEGIQPMRWDERADRHAFHLYMVRYDEHAFGVPRDLFEQALEAEGIPCSTGYPFPLYRQQSLSAEFARATHCPHAEQACREAIWLPQWLLLADPHEMDDVVAAVIKIRDHRDELRYAASL